MSERELVMDYLKGRYESAFLRGDWEESRSCHNFYEALEGMTDGEYDLEFADPVEVGAIS